MLINKKTLFEINRVGIEQDRFFVLVKERQIYFSAAVCRYLKISPGLKMHFINEGDSWQFFIDVDPDGFNLTFNSKGGLDISNTGLCKMIFKTTGYCKQKKFTVRLSDSQIDGRKIYCFDPL